MPRTTAQALDHFYDNYVKPSSAQVIDVAAKRAKSEEYLRNLFPSSSDMPLKRVILIGSADRKTHIQPVGDVDVLAEFRNKDDVFEKYRFKSGDFLQRIRRALDAQTSIKKIGARGQAVRLFYTSGAHVDIAPVFKWSGQGYALPSGDGNWITTDPEEQAEWYSSRRSTVGPNLSKVVRIAKRWNHVHSGRFESFHLEVLVASAFSNLGSNSRDALKMLFDSASGWLDVSDPAGHSGSLSSYLSYSSRRELVDRLSGAARRAGLAIEAESRGDHQEAKRLWRIELGDDFSTY